jgi:hypothetical protein
MEDAQVARTSEPVERSGGGTLEEIAQRIRTLDRILIKKALEVYILRDPRSSLVRTQRELSACVRAHKRTTTQAHDNANAAGHVAVTRP